MESKKIARIKKKKNVRLMGRPILKLKQDEGKGR
jgi:hypothetical protein